MRRRDVMKLMSLAMVPLMPGVAMAGLDGNEPALGTRYLLSLALA